MLPWLLREGARAGKIAESNQIALALEPTTEQKEWIMNTSNRAKAGLTLLELAMAMIAIGILSALLIPRILDLSSYVGQASAERVAAALAVGSAINLSSRQARNPAGMIINQSHACDASILGPLLRGAAVPPGHSIEPAAGAVGMADDCAKAPLIACVVTAPHNGRAVAFIYCSQ